MSITREPATPGYLWAPQPAPVTAWAPPAAPQPWAPAPVASGWPQPMPPAAPRRRRLPIAIAASAAVLAATTGLAVAVTHHAHGSTAGRPATAAAPAVPPPPPALVRDEALPSLLLDTATVNAVMVTTDIAVNPKLTAVKLFDDTTTKPECGGVWANVNAAAYAGSGWQAVRNQYLREPDKPQHEVYQSVVSFPTAAAATDFVTTEGRRWPLCRNTAITTTVPNIAAQTWLVTDVGRDGEMLTSVSSREGLGGYLCQHALTARNNVVVDVEACGWDIAHQGSTIAGRIAEQITRTL